MKNFLLLKVLLLILIYEEKLIEEEYHQFESLNQSILSLVLKHQWLLTSQKLKQSNIMCLLLKEHDITYEAVVPKKQNKL